MKRKPIYSASRQRTVGMNPVPAAAGAERHDGSGNRGAAALPARGASKRASRQASSHQQSAIPVAAPITLPAVPRTGWRQFLPRRSWLLPMLGGAVGAVLMGLALDIYRPAPPAFDVKAMIKAVKENLIEEPLPAQAQLAYEKIAGSVVLVRGHGAEDQESAAEAPGIGTGVVVVDKGTILTNLHVVAGADHVSVTFADGSESPARIVGTRPESDLAVLQASIVPDKLPAATLRSSQDLASGAGVIAVGFPFGIGPSVSAGVVSGVKREFRSHEGSKKLTNLIQFDAAANPGNSGGPLVTMDGQVVGIVTAILNPTEHRIFAGIGFAVPIEDAASAVGPSPF